MTPNSRSSTIRIVILSIIILALTTFWLFLYWPVTAPPSVHNSITSSAPVIPTPPPPPPTVSNQPNEDPPPGFRRPAEAFAAPNVVPFRTQPDPRVAHTMPAISPDYVERQKQFAAEFDGNHAITLYIDQIPGDMDGFFMNHVRQLTQSKASRATLSAGRETIQFASPIDPLQFADQVDFGTVRAINTADRTLWILADPKKIPPPLLPEATVSVAPGFYPRNFEDLSSWSDERRVDALRHLAVAPPTAMRGEITRAIRNLLKDAKPEIRREAIRAYANWGDDDRILVLLPALGDPDYFTREYAMQMLGKLHDARAAPALCELLESNDARPAMQALITLGPVAEPALLDRLNRGSDQAQRCVVEVLATIGTSKSLPALNALASQNTGLASMIAKRTITAIQSRTTPTSRPQ